MDDAPPSLPPDADTRPDAATVRRRRALAWAATLWSIFICALLVLFITAALPWPAPRGVYSPIGAGMLLPFLLMGALIALCASAMAVFVVARLSGLPRRSTAACTVLAAVLALLVFAAGFTLAGH